jgi:reactive intermediate/imine deaminase
MPSREVVTTARAPQAVGPYSQGILSHGFLFCSGALPIDAESGALRNASLAAETQQSLTNLAALCRAAGTDLSRALRMTIYTTSLDGFAEINAAYAEFFPLDPPARVTVGVAALPLGARVEIDAVVDCSL